VLLSQNDEISDSQTCGIGIALVGPATAHFLSRCNAESEANQRATRSSPVFDLRSRHPYCRAKLERITPMRMPMQARLNRYTLLTTAMLLGACGRDVTSPAPVASQKATEAKAMPAPESANRALIGVPDGTYSVTFNTAQNQSLWLGENHLDIPAYAICNLVTSGYGAAYWDKPCTPQTGNLTLTVIIKDSQSDHPQVDFFPAMRFNPSKNVQLFMYAPKVSRTDAKNWWMFYCNDAGQCVDESKTDVSLRTYIDYDANMLFRRVKHFSGYVVAERGSEEPTEGSSLQ
jgi:hypothetical protein